MSIEDLKQRNVSIFTACAGAGAGLAQRLWEVPGSSAYFEGGLFINAPDELRDFLGFEPGNCSEETAMDMAMASYMRAYKPDSGKDPIGLGLTASVATTEIHRGEHRIHAAVMCEEGMFVKTIVLEKGEGAFARGVDGRIADTLGIDMIDRLGSDLANDLGSTAAFARLMARPVFAPDGTRGTGIGKVAAIFPGAFNPPTYGHAFIAATVSFMDHDSRDVIFAITVDAPHKDHLSLQEILKRAKLMKLEGLPLMFTQGDPLYIDKARKFPGTALIMGADAVIRMLDPKWGVDPDKLLEELTQLGTVIYVPGREIDGKWTTIHDITIPRFYRRIFTEVTGRWDISSTELREGAA